MFKGKVLFRACYGVYKFLGLLPGCVRVLSRVFWLYKGLGGFFLMIVVLPFGVVEEFLEGLQNVV